MQAFLVSTGVVALGEMGDKTQLLALLLAARFKRPWPLGAGVAAWLGTEVLRWVIGASFIAIAVWMLVPDEADEAPAGAGPFGVFGTTVIAFFLAEMGDKTQIATVALAARYTSLLAVVAGTTLGMMIANVPAVLLGDKVAKKVPMRLVHAIAAAIFGVLGVATLLGLGSAG
jgi:Ca2+/H+ antiporter, TMEM165/GDT1 family